MAAYQNALSTAQNVADTGYSSYTGQKVAGFSDDTLAAMQGTQEMQGMALPYIDAATTALYNAMGYADPSNFNAESLSQYYNPYQQDVIDATMANMKEMNASQQNYLTGDAIKKGYMGGDRVGIARAEMAKNQDLTNNAALAQLQQQGYESAVKQYNQQQQTAIGASQAGAYGLGSLGTQAQNSVLQGLQALFGSGSAQESKMQQQLTSDYEDWQSYMGYPYEQAQWLAALVSAIGGNMGGTTTSSSYGSSSKTDPSPSTGGTVAGLLTSGLSLLPKFSDVRAKTDIEPVAPGLYAFRYKNDPKTYPKVVGPIAQEVEMSEPERIVDFGGLKGILPREAVERDGYAEGGLTYVEAENPFDDPQRRWQEGMRQWVSAAPEEEPAPLAGGGLAGPLAVSKKGHPYNDETWIPEAPLHPSAPQFPAPAKPVDLDMGGGGGGGGGGDIMGSLTKGLGALASKFSSKDPAQLTGAAPSAPAGETVPLPTNSADDSKFLGIFADGGRVGYAEGGAPIIGSSGAAGTLGNLYAGWAERGAATGEAGSSLAPAFEANTTRTKLPTAPTKPTSTGMNPMMMMGGGSNAGMMALMGAIQQQQAENKYQSDLSKYNSDKEAVLSAPKSVVGYTAKSRDYSSIDPSTGLYSASGWDPMYEKIYADGGRVDELEGFDSRKFHPELTRERGSERGVSEMSLGDADELLSAMQRRQQPRPGRLRGGEIEEEGLTLNPIGRIIEGDPHEYEQRPVGVPLPPDHRPQEFEQRAAARGLTFDEAADQTRKFEGRYSNDSGGPTMYGISSKAHPGLDVRSITPQQARGMYKKEYWDAIGADSIEDPALRRIAYDTAIISGAGRARQFMEQSGGDPEKFMQAREAFMQRLVAQNPRKYSAYERGWNNRNAELRRTAGLTGDEGGAPMAYAGPQLASRHPGLGAIDANFRNSRETGGLSRAPAEEERTGLGSMWSPEVQQGLLAAGLGMMASRSPHMGVAIGEGGLRGLQAYQAAKSGAGDAEYRRAQLDHLLKSDAREDEQWDYKKRAQERSEKAWELLTQKPPGEGEPAREPSASPGTAPAIDAPVGPAPTGGASDKSWEARPKYDDGAPREAGAPAPQKASAPGAPIDIRPGAQKPAEEPAKEPTAPVGEFKVPREVQNKLREYNHWNAKASTAASLGNETVAAEAHRRAEEAKFEYTSGLQQAKDEYQRQFDREKYQTTERRAAEEAELKKKQADPAYQEALEGKKAAAHQRNIDMEKTWTDIQKKANEAVVGLNTYRTMLGYMDDPNFNTGPGSPLIDVTKRIMVEAGRAPGDYSSADEAFDVLSKQGVLAAAGGSLGPGVSNSDVGIFLGMAANRNNSIAGNRMILQASIALEKRKQDIAEEAQKYAEEHGGSLDRGWSKHLKEWAEKNPMFDPKLSRSMQTVFPKFTKEQIAQTRQVLQSNPESAKIFDERYGAGASDLLLGR